MKAVFASVPERILEWRHQTGADRWDEMWEGVLHMAPSPNRDHQTFEYQLLRWLDDHWAEPNGCQVYHQRNVAEAGSWPDNYRVPDLVLVTPGRFNIDQNEYFDGGPDVVVEISSPDDESHEKLDFYFKVGVSEVWIIERDSKRPEVYVRTSDGRYQSRKPGEGWLRSDVAGAEFRAAQGGKLEIRLVARPAAVSRLP
jgi:Uma2 family endonuclease